MRNVFDSKYNTQMTELEESREMKGYMQRIGRSLMLPVATLPIAALLWGLAIG